MITGSVLLKLVIVLVILAAITLVLLNMGDDPSKVLVK